MFSKKTFDFMFENRLNNSREWFIAHKNEYNDFVLNPLITLGEAIAPTIEVIDNQIITEAKVDKTISRIYRDTRFSKDKMLYREEFWLSYRRDKKAFPQYPEFFFVVMPNEFIYGCGYYAAKSDVMDCIRNLILENDPMFLAAQKAYESQSDFVLEGDMYKKSKHPEQPEQLRNWLDRKSISVMIKSSDFSLLYSEMLSEQIITTYRKMENIYKFFIYAENKSNMKKLLN